MNFSVKFQDKNVLDVKTWHRKLLIYQLGEFIAKFVTAKVDHLDEMLRRFQTGDKVRYSRAKHELS